SFTQVSSLAPLAGLAALQELDCSGCYLRCLPPGILDNASLRELVLYESQVPGIPPTGILSRRPGENCLEALRAYFTDLAKGVADVSDVKLVLLGNGGVGKTQIANWLTGKPFEPEWNSTHGIRIGLASLPGDTPMRLHVWDFGGQDIYLGTHALFLRSPAVLMPVWAEDMERRATYDYGGLTFRNHPLDYWIDVARHQGHPHSPVLVVQNKCDRPDQEVVPFPVRAEAWKDLPYRRQLHVSAKENRRREPFMAELREAVAWLRDPERLGMAQVGAGWLHVQQRLEALRDADMGLPRDRRRHRLLERAEFERICAEAGGVSSPGHLLAYLDANGTVFHRSGLFNDHVVLDQSWALEAIYAVFDRKGALQEIRRWDGRFTRAQLARSVWRDYGEAEQRLFLSMMRSCGICFLHRRFDDEVGGEEGEYIAPDLLPERETVRAELDGRWDADRPSELAVFRYALLHGGLIRAVLSKVGEAAGTRALYWQGGVCGYEARTGSRLLIEQEMTGPWQGEIKLRTQRGQTAVLLDRLVEIVERAQAGLGLQPSSVERPSVVVETRERSPMELGQEKPASSEWYISYAWGDTTPEGQAREQVVKDLCAAAEARGLHVLRDRDVVRLGDSISAFMERIGAADQVFVILSDKYLRSPYCMFELSEIWRTSKRKGPALLERVRVYTLGDADIWKPISRARYAAHWKQQHDEMDAFVRDNGGTSILGERDFADFKRMGEFYRHVGDILATLADIRQPRDFNELERYSFGGDPG
ncbi:MAG: TIR domain-containing protein, partial [Sinobacteraceae bacterium]|nr:TIR domain-containing protein [Nevskiaceae bacterium]